MVWFLRTNMFSLLSVRMRCFRLWSFSIVGCLRKLQVAERWCMSGGRSLKLDGTVLTLMALHQLALVELVVVA